MYPANKKMDAVHSGTGVFYQAMPAVGADGKNIMKLIPVQMVNGQFFKKTVRKTMGPAPQIAVSKNTESAPVKMKKKAALNPFVAQEVIRKVSLLNALPNQVGLDLCNSTNKQPILQKPVNLMPKVPPKATSTAIFEKPSFSGQLPVTVKSPALPRGQYLQIPPNAQVRIVPGSELPPGIKKQIFTSLASSSPGSGLPSVIYVSPVTTVNQSVTPPSDSAALHSSKLLCKPPSVPSCGPPSKGLQKHLKLIPKVVQRPNSPLKWTVEEEDGSAAPPLDPLRSPSVTSEILLAVAQRENASKRSDTTAKPASPLSQSKSGQGQENALVMCNGKVFFVAKNCKQSLETKTDNSPLASTKSNQSSKTMQPSSQQSLASVAPKQRQDLSIIISDESDEVIDLCDDDDAQDDLPQQEAASTNMSAATHLDEDNVIFVSYMPPKSDSGSAQNVPLNTQEADQRGTNCVTEQNSPDVAAGCEDQEEISPRTGRKCDQSQLVSTAENLWGSAEMSMHDEEGMDNSSQQSTSSKQLEYMDVDLDTECPADPSIPHSSNGIYFRIEEDTHKLESCVTPETSSSLTPKSSEKANSLLRQMFKITADVKICLQRIDESSAFHVPPEFQSDHQEPAIRSEEVFSQNLCSSQRSGHDEGFINFKHEKSITAQELSVDHVAPSAQIHAGPLKCSHFKLNSSPLSTLTCNSDQKSPQGTPCSFENEPLSGFVEPIDEDFLSTDENDIPKSQDADAGPQTAMRVELNINTRRRERTRKRTTCPCCIPVNEVPAVKSSTKSLEQERWAWTMEKISKKGGRAKAVRKNQKSPGTITCLMAKNKQKCKTSEVPASDILSTTSVDSELKRLEQIKRLKELLRKKEAALELMRNSVS